jgi:hypothetical protein
VNACTEPTHARWDYVVEVLKIFRGLDIEEDLFWHFHAKPYDYKNPEYVEYPTFWVVCSDFFHWASADGEDIDPEDLPLLKQCIEDLKATGAQTWQLDVGLLFAARKRGMRPMRLWLKRLRYGDYHEPDRRSPEKIEAWKAEHGESHEKMYQLFVAAGPERTRESEG